MPDRPPSLLRLGGALALLLLVAPLGSIYRAYNNAWYHRQEGMNMHSDPVLQAAAAAAAAAHASRARQSQQQSDDARTSSSSTDNSAGPGIKNIGTFVVNGEDMDDKISMEELLSLLGVGFGRRHHHHHHHHHIVLQNLGLGLGIGGARRASDISVGIHLIMPWLLALLFGVVIPAILAVIGRIRQRRGRTYYDKLSSKEKRLFRLIQCFSRFKKTIREGDMVGSRKISSDGGAGGGNGASSSEKDDEDDGGDDEQTAEEDRLLRIPRAGSPLLPPNTQSDDLLMQIMRQVPAICTICLDPYKAGEIVVWSSNTKCKDCFHEQCIVAWLSKRRGGSDARCPCCRQHFIDDIFRVQAGLNSK